MPNRRSIGGALSRRALLAGAAGLTAAGLGLTTDSTSAPVEQRVSLAKNVSVERIYSQARKQAVDMVVIHPKGVDPRGLPVCLMLHGRFGDALDSVSGLPMWLSNSVAAGRIPPFTLLSVDGGPNNYWHRRPGDDAMGMLLDEVPQWLSERELGKPIAAAGISMGGFGALVYARRRRELGDPLQTAGVIAPALHTSWREMRKRRAFTNEAEWRAIDPLHHLNALGDLPIGVWCGNADRFIEGTRRFIRLTHPTYASTSPGRHNKTYFRKALPELVDFIGGHIHP
ncbi:alpha/beta hydrolase-fold protein [Saccharopolyspora sp. TS4A08]|uniref:Acyl-CoA:diacylglycerol acyltransferase n=1 Tax=Saccharopolyspora ipomoeae TaxID=3042027 RepID=A0ABT6PS72_9PSEU|nr:alpha/beta hydrolase-fold protein [Saccharopolyspora sp. TS4A08]MDI2030823.1 alpha/beta hydrolase-fold protein [Saccharopolyspora sp. TS4A08]